ncbi:hypothetical protein HaLaN_13051 [Haematococcus lacustris]|uniref:Uncharacterized protein n=1 Tax=Haematococcus lacustris TaxID=44745 RepID=A0A699ZCG9_HAELA|nr:hypothetical protein HaLaN_13051 [Haematococcus lacustris]
MLQQLQELLAKLQQLGSVNLTGDHNTISHHSMQLAVAMQQHYSNPGNSELQAATLDKGHVADLIEEGSQSVADAVSAASGVWDPQSGQLMADQLRRWKLTKGQHLAAASSAGTSLEANLKHITVTLATWDAVWEVYLDPKWAQQRLRLYGAQDRAQQRLRLYGAQDWTLQQFFMKLEEDMAEVSMERHGRAKQLVVIFGAAGIGTRGGWGADALRIGESRWRPLELCWWPEQGKLPAKGKEYPGLGYKRVRDKPPKAQQQQPAAAQ